MAPQSRSRPSRPETSPPGPFGGEQRLQKVLAAAGISSRRECESLIRDGRVEVDHQVVTELGYRVDPVQHEIRVDGVALTKPKLVHFALNKPAGVVSTNRDPAGRPRVVDLIPSEQRIFPVGRLDRSSEGLIILTNDGDLANRLTHPRYGVEKTYAVRVAGQMTPETIRQLQKGVYLAEGVARVNSVQIKHRHKQSTDLEIVLDEGRNREIRRVLARVGHKVLKLTRIAIGALRLGELPSGAYRRLTTKEIRDLQRAGEPQRGDQEGAARRGRGSRKRLARLKSPAEGGPTEKTTEKSAARQAPKAAGKRAPKPLSRLGAKSAARPAKPGAKPGAKPPFRPGAKPGTRPGARPGVRQQADRPPKWEPGTAQGSILNYDDAETPVAEKPQRPEPKPRPPRPRKGAVQGPRKGSPGKYRRKKGT